MRRMLFMLLVVLVLCGGNSARAEGEDPLPAVSGVQMLERRQELTAAGDRIEDSAVRHMGRIGLDPVTKDGGFLAPYPAGGLRGPSAAGRNLLGGITGLDVRRRAELVLVAAPTRSPGELAVVLHVAEVLRASRWKPRRTILFAGLGGEKGLDGARAIARGAPSPEDSVVAALLIEGVPSPEEKGDPIASFRGFARSALGRSLLKALPKGGEGDSDLIDSGGDLPRPASAGDPLADRGIPTFRLSEGKGLVMRFARPEDPGAFTDPDGPWPEPLPSPPPEAPDVPLARIARRLVALVLRLGDTPEALFDAHAFHRMLLCEAPRAARTLEIPEASPDRAMGLCIALRDATAGAPRKAAGSLPKALEGRIPGAVPSRLVRETFWGWRWLEAAPSEPTGLPWFRLRWADRLPAPAEIAEARQEGFFWIAPFASGVRTSAVERAALVEAVVREQALLDLEGLKPEELVEAARHSGGRPAVLPVMAADWLGPAAVARRQALGPSVLLLADGDPSAALRLALDDRSGLAPAVVVTGDSTGLLDALVTTEASHGARWGDTQSADRKALYAALGGRLVEWVKRLR